MVKNWTEALVTFQKLPKTSPADTLAERQNVGKSIFGKYTLLNEWVPLYFRVSLEDTEHISDIQRVHELELRMLTDLDGEALSRTRARCTNSARAGGVGKTECQNRSLVFDKIPRTTL